MTTRCLAQPITQSELGWPNKTNTNVTVFVPPPYAWFVSTNGVYKDLGTTPAANGDLVEQWNDISGNGFILQKINAPNRPTFITAGINGKPSLLFIFGNAFDNPGSPTWTAVQPLTYFYVIEVTSGTPGQMLDGFIYGTTGGVFNCGYGEDNSTAHWGMFAGATLTASSGPSTGTRYIVCSQFNSTTSLIRVNGTQVASGDSGTGDPGAIQMAYTDTTLSVSEIRVYQGALTLSQIQAVEADLSSKY